LFVFADRRLRAICSIIVLGILSISAYPSVAASPSPAPEQAAMASKALRLSVNEAVGLFLSQNLDVLIAKYGIEYTRGQEVTARLFPNPLLSVGTQSSYSQGRTLSNSGQLVAQVSQLFE
jgi:outer membrane protein, heavy metal efflux system